MVVLHAGDNLEEQGRPSLEREGGREGRRTWAIFNQ